ncbi:MAG: CHRD domain-containing protein [Candidatus Krumholzibacteria bacterium]|nr:CHRD domain-containing protein [Candidatus Krumholzibacteria bacterium]
MTRLVWLLVLLPVFLVPTRASAETVNFCVTLDGAQEVPPVTSFSGGSGTLAYDTATRMLTLSVFYDMQGTAFAAHIHGPAPPGENAPRVFDLNLPNPFSGVITDTVGPVEVSEEGDLLNGLWYINVHTNTNEGGEIRGQIASCPVPVEPTSWGHVKALYR